MTSVRPCDMVTAPTMSRLTRAARALTPTIATEWLAYADRFARLGMPRRWCTDARRKLDLSHGAIELLPPDVRRSPGVVIDVGSNAGHWSAAVLRTLHVERLLAFEPHPDIAEMSRQAVAAFPQATVHAVGLGDKSGRLELRCEGSADLASFLPLRDDVRGAYGVDGSMRIMDVPVRRLDEFTEDIARVGILKLDVQGFECRVLSGGARTLAKTACILIEVLYVQHYEGESSFDDIHRMLTDHGFRLRVVSPPWMSPDGTPMWADAVYARA